MVLKGLGREIDLKKFNEKMDGSRPKKGRDRFFNFSQAPSILYQKIEEKFPCGKCKTYADKYTFLLGIFLAMFHIAFPNTRPAIKIKLVKIKEIKVTWFADLIQMMS